ncbi:MAG: tyrosine-type recombinase/integrase [Planctomycetota bacterium]
MRLIYELVLQPGQRANEVRTLTRESFDLDGREPQVTVVAERSKRRKEDHQPLLPEMAARLRAHLATKMPAAPAVHLNRYSARMLQGDLEDAGIPVKDARGRVMDFHALRHTFITNLARCGGHVKVAQQLARHSTITLTMDVYSQVSDSEARAGVEALRQVAGA